MSKDPPTVEMISDGDDLFVAVNGVKVAKRGRPGTPQANTWVSLGPGWTVLGGFDFFVQFSIRPAATCRQGLMASDRHYPGRNGGAALEGGPYGEQSCFTPSAGTPNAAN
jgi:hypothetical protein